MKQTPLYNVHLSLGAKMFTTASGYGMPAYYATVEKEHNTVRESVGMIDLSLMGRIDIKGTEALDLIQKLAVNDAERIIDGQIMYTTFCNEIGNIVDDVTVWRFNEEHYRVITSSLMRSKSLKWIQKNLKEGMNAYVTDVSSALGCIAIQGPRSRGALQKICEGDLANLRFFRFMQANLAGIPAIVARVGFTGELGFECYVGAEETVEVWKSLAEAGRDYGILPYGLDVLDTLRYEKGFIFFGYEVNERNNPFECGLDRWVRFEKAQFLGKEALLRIREEGPKQRLVGLQLETAETVKPGVTVERNGQKIGTTLLSFHGITVNKNIAWAFVGTQHIDFGSKVKITGDVQEVDAIIVDNRLYDPKNEGMRT